VIDRIAALRLFVRLVERGSFSAAAADLKIKQSTASKWVAEIEAELGVALVQRTTRSLQVTEDGQRFRAHAREVIAAFDAMRAELAERNPVPHGRVRISAPVVFGQRFVVPALAGFLVRHPDVHAEIVFADRYVNLVDEGFDLAIRVGVPVDTTARGRKLADSRRVLVAAPAYLAARGKPRTPRALTGHDCLIHGDGNTAMVWRFGRGRSAEIPVTVRGRVAANNSEAVLALARHGLGIALLADWLVTADLARGRLVELLPRFHAPPAPVYALAPPARFASTLVRALTDHLADAWRDR